MNPRANPLLKLAFAHTAIVCIVLHIIGGTIYFHVLPFSRKTFAVSQAEELVRDLVDDVERFDRRELDEFFHERHNLYARLTRGVEEYSNYPLFFRRNQPPTRPEGPFEVKVDESTYWIYNNVLTEGPLAGVEIQVARDSAFIYNAINAVIIRYELLVLLICLILFYAFLSTAHSQLKGHEIDESLIKQELNAATFINIGIQIILIALVAVSYYREGLIYALVHQMGPLLESHLNDSHPLFNAWILILLVVIEVVTGCIPGAILYPSAGILFGASLGTVYVLIGTVIGSAIGYLQGRSVSLSFEAKETQAGEFSDYLEKQGNLGVFILRVNPITSFSFVNQVAGVVGTRFPGFLIATTLARAPMVFLATVAGTYVFHNYKGAVPIIVGAVTIYLFYLGIRIAMDAGRWQRKYMQLYVTNVNQMGAATASSDFLARKMVDHIRFREGQVVLELGPGTGVFTQRILDRAPKTCRILTVEANEVLAQHMIEHFPAVKTISGDARNLREYLAAEGLEKADVIICGLPFLSLPQAITEKILEEIEAVLSPQGTFVLFQYTLLLLPQIKKRFDVTKINWTALNVPPAFVFTCAHKVPEKATAGP